MDSLLQSDKRNIWHPFTPLNTTEEPVLIRSASGVYLHTDDGRDIIDAVSSWWVNLHGHAHPAIARAVADQAKILEHVIFAGFTHEPAIRLSENVLSILPTNQARVFFSDNGSTAVEVALKMAMQYWHHQGATKKSIIAIDGAYHGDTFGSMSVGERGLFTKPFFPWLFETRFIDFPHTGVEHETVAQFKQIVDHDDVGIFIFEPLLQGASGMRMYPPAILDEMIEYAQQKNIVCIADEVLTGFGRTGKNFASDYLSHKPDIMALSKGLTGGTMPLGVTTCSEKILSAFMGEGLLNTFFHGHSYTANPLACAAANASFTLLMDPSCQGNIKRISGKHQDFKIKLRQHGKLSDIRCLGTVLALELKTKEVSSYANEARKKIYDFFLERNILLRPLGNVIYVLPPYIISDQELDSVYAAIETFLDGY